MPVVVFVLAAATFAQGTSEFMVSGLLGPIAAACGVSVGVAGLLTSLFAVGMVVGAPVMATVAGAVPRRTALLGFLVLFGCAHVLGALTADFAVLLGTRVVAAVANAGFLAVALATLPALVPAEALGRATAVILSGVTVACIVGVPAGTVLGQVLGWQATFWAVAVLTAAAVAALAPATATLGRPRVATGVGREWRTLGRGGLPLLLVLGVLVNGGTFAGFTYLGTIAAARSTADSAWVPAALALFGVGSFAGVTLAGRCPDRYRGLLVTAGSGVLAVVWLGAVAAVGTLPGLLVAAVVTGAGAFGVGSTLITAIVRAASPAAPRIGGAVATTAFNLGAVLGPAVAGLAVTDTAHAGSALWTGVGASAAAALVAVAARWWRENRFPTGEPGC